MKKIMICLLFSTIFLTACSLNDSQDTNKSVDNNKPNKVAKQNSVDTPKEKNVEQKGITENPNDTSVEDNKASKDGETEQNISERVKNYIINNQENISEAEKIKWSKTFLNEVDIESLYNQYIATGGNIDDLEKFAIYMTLNAPISSNWEKLFEKDLYDIYGEKVVRLEHLEDDLYQAYIKKDGSEIPYVVVSSRTGYFHG